MWSTTKLGWNSSGKLQISTTKLFRGEELRDSAPSTGKDGHS